MRLDAEIVSLGGLTASAATPDPSAPDAADEHALVVDLVREGYELHYGTPRVVTSADPDLALLVGDQLYARGLHRLAERGDLAAITELADLITLSARAHAEDDPARAEAAWASARRPER